MICPRCGENNPDNYKFCGMCGTNLQSAPQDSEKVVSKTSTQPSQGSTSRGQSMAFSRMEPRGGIRPGTLTIDEPRPSRPVEPPRTEEPVEPIAGPSLLGLNQPTPETIRETTFRGMTTYYPEERHPAWGRILLTLIFIVGLVALGWWRYKSYGLPGHGKPGWLSAMNKTNPPSENQPPEYGTKPAAPNAGQNSDQNQNSADQNKAVASGDTSAATGQAANPGATAADKTSTGADKTSDNTAAESKSADSTSAKPADKNAQPADAASASAKPAKPAKPATSTDDDNSAPAPKLKPAAASGEGDGLFRRGEAYLYGRGVPESCSQAIRYLKSASDKSSAKARSTFGTMYATGHCVPRDLPTSYRWFAMALQADPNNSILEKDLGAIWNQMTPPERQLATKLKPNGE